MYCRKCKLFVSFYVTFQNDEGFSCTQSISTLQFAVGVYDHLMSVGRELGVRNGGMYALDSLRMEKGYRHWGHELDTDTTPLEARLSFAVNMNKV